MGGSRDPRTTVAHSPRGASTASPHGCKLCPRLYLCVMATGIVLTGQETTAGLSPTQRRVMHACQIKRALIAVFDKSGITEFARVLSGEFGIEILSTGGTARHLREAGVPVTMVEQVTGFPEMLDGRVKTLHPMVHGGILADRDKPDHLAQLDAHGIAPIDMVIVNLYPFEQTIAKPGCTFEQAVEMIDIGGPCMVRAAAKNHRHVVVMVDLALAETVLGQLRGTGQVDQPTRRRLAEQAFATTAAYDTLVSNYLAGEPADALPAQYRQQFRRVAALRYGENPAQPAAAYLAQKPAGEAGLLTGKQLGGEPMSFNNYMDGDSALSLVKELSRAFPGKAAMAFIKHTNACGCAIGADPVDTYRRAYLGDPVAAAGGVLCMNVPVTRAIAETVMGSYGSWGKAAGAAFFKLDVWVAPAFEPDALALITTPTEKRKWGASCRLLAVGSMDGAPDQRALDTRTIVGGLLVQRRDLLGLNESEWKVATKRTPDARELADLRFAWLVCKHTKSNSITVCRDETLLGNGAGQMSRVKSCELAVGLAREHGHGAALAGAVAAGDAFFPVEDGPQILLDAGITAIIHPGGSNRDADTLAVADRSGAAMVITGARHFKH